MTVRHFVTGALALSVLGAAAVPALAQDYIPPQVAYDREHGYAYDPCHRDTVDRGTGGAVVGALAGAVVGSQVAGSGHRTDGSLLGGVLGAVIGHKVGRDSAACNDEGDGYRTRGYQTYGYQTYGYRGGYGYRQDYYRERAYPGGYGHYPHDGYREGYRDGRRDGDQDDYVITDRPADRDGCRLAESPVYMPNGEVQKRYVRVCPDGQGHYQIVD
jgi:hypothetical protein